MEGLVNSIFEPGVNQSLLIATNVAFIFLLIVLVLIGVFVEWNIHVIFISILTFLLWMAINWYAFDRFLMTSARSAALLSHVSPWLTYFMQYCNPNFPDISMEFLPVLFAETA